MRNVWCSIVVAVVLVLATSCTGSPACRTAGDPCSLNVDCCGGYVCDNGRCAVANDAPSCGKQSESCATVACCGGLVCGNGRCGADATTSSMTWTITNSYPYEVEIMFFDKSASPRLRWPADSRDVFSQQPGTTVDYSLRCTSGHSVCYGAEDPARNKFWGVGLDYQKCDGCCRTCNGQTHLFNLQ